MVDYGTLVLSRRLRRPPERAGAALAALTRTPLASLVLERPFERRVSGAFHPAERTTAALLPVGRRTVERVELEVGPWSGDATEIRLRPAARRPERWTARRMERYFRHAHVAADEVLTCLERLVPEPRPHVEPVRRSA
jgi:hypothetical protein